MSQQLDVNRRQSLDDLYRQAVGKVTSVCRRILFAVDVDNGVKDALDDPQFTGFILWVVPRLALLFSAAQLRLPNRLLVTSKLGSILDVGFEGGCLLPNKLVDVVLKLLGDLGDRRRLKGLRGTDFRRASVGRASIGIRANLRRAASLRRNASMRRGFRLRRVRSLRRGASLRREASASLMTAAGRISGVALVDRKILVVLRWLIVLTELVVMTVLVLVGILVDLGVLVVLDVLELAGLLSDRGLELSIGVHGEKVVSKGHLGVPGVGIDRLWIDEARLRSWNLLGELRVARSEGHGSARGGSHRQGEEIAVEGDHRLLATEVRLSVQGTLLGLRVAVGVELAHGGRVDVLGGHRGVHAVDVVRLLTSEARLTLKTVASRHGDRVGFPEARELVYPGDSPLFVVVVRLLEASVCVVKVATRRPSGRRMERYLGRCSG